MPPLKYHTGQIAIQEEAHTRAVADHLAHWVGPVGEFALGADLFVLAAEGPDDNLHFTVLSGPAPLVEVAGPSKLRLRFPDPSKAPAPGRCGGLAMNLGYARRARINGMLDVGEDGVMLEADETFTLCRKYMAPSLTMGETIHVGPVATSALPLDDPWLARLLAEAEVSFLGSAAPSGAPDVAHRGGPPGFLSLDPVARTLTWPEFVGDGVFKSAGNVRATGRMTLLVPDVDTGDAVELIGTATYENVRTQRSQRLEPLVQFRDHYPIQGTVRCALDGAIRLAGLMQPRRRIEKALKVTSRSTIDEQAPR
jgi:hypothetical protein